MKNVGGLLVYAWAFWGASGTCENIASMYNAKSQGIDYTEVQPIKNRNGAVKRQLSPKRHIFSWTKK